MKENTVKEKSFRFAVRMVNLYKHLSHEEQACALSKQALRSGTAAGAIVHTAECSENNADFSDAMALAQKEMNDTIYWLELMHKTGSLTDDAFDSLRRDAVELIKILAETAQSSFPTS
ncbi:MAG: four helix bundle protein [Prevotellaceae bacterium]|jgi:four helix bundle protein|nr:four helix bundle protein [Prevotellaceae bacterium]